MNEAMHIDSFRALLDARGADMNDWPHAQRLAAQALLRASTEAQQELASAQALEQTLSALRMHSVTPGLATRISALAEPVDPLRPLFDWLTEKLWRPAAMLLAPLMVGAIIGATVPGEEERYDTYLADYPWIDTQEFVIDE